MKKFGFTLIEILAVISIIAILSAIGIGLASVASARKAEARTEAVLSRLRAALEEVKLKHGYYPQSDATCLIKFEQNPTLDANKVITSAVAYPAAYVNDFQKAFGREDFQSMATRTSGTGESGSTNVYVFVDGWGNPIYYRCPGKRNPASYDLFSTGADGAAGADKTGTEPKALYEASKSGGNTAFTLKNTDPVFDNKEYDDMGNF